MTDNRQAALQFFAKARGDAQLSAALAKAQNEAEVIELAKRHGCELDAEAIAACAGIRPQALEDAAVAEQVVGGASDIDPFPPVRVGSRQWRELWHGPASGQHFD